MKICIVIPVHNESEKIGGIIETLRGLHFDVVVVDDGSTDDSGRIAKEKEAVVISHSQKCGKGFSLRDGFSYATGRDYDGVIAMDGDGQHDIGDIQKFIKKASEDKDCVITGNRMDNAKGMPLVRFAVNHLMSFMISWLCGQKVPDTQCGFRYIGTNVLKNITLLSSGFEIESEVLVASGRKGYRIHSVAIKTIYCNECSKIQPIKDTIRFIGYFFREVRRVRRQ